jgi:hypothetical protein
MNLEVEWANGMEGGHVCGRDAVRPYWTRLWRRIAPRVERQRFVTNDTGNIVVDVHQIVRGRSGTSGGISGNKGLGGRAVAVDRLGSVVALPEGVSDREAMLLLDVFARLKEHRFGRLIIAMSDGKIVDVEVVEKIDHDVLRRLPM